LSAALVLGLATAASAAMVHAPLGSNDGVITRVAEGCGDGWWRDPNGHCHPFHPRYGSLRSTQFACPPGMHIGPYGHRCWPY
jgi:hypothetical protein